MTLLTDMETVIEDTQFGDPSITEIVDDADADSWCRCSCYCKQLNLQTSYGIELMAGVDFGK